MKKVGLALGGGGARALSHIGVIKVLEEEGIPIDYIAGTSMGALVGGIYAATHDVKGLVEKVRSFDYQEWWNIFVDPGLRLGLIRGDKMEEKIREIVGKVRIEELATPFACVATDINTAKTVVIDKGDLAHGIRASSSMPLVFYPALVEGSMVVDGGLSNPVPVEIVRQMGAEVVIAVNLDAVYFNEKNRRPKQIGALDIMKNSLFLLRYHLAEKESRNADMIITPDIEYISEFDLVKKDSVVIAGEVAARDCVGKIRELLV